MVVEDHTRRNISESSMSSSSSSRAAALKRKNVKIAEKVSANYTMSCLSPGCFVNLAVGALLAVGILYGGRAVAYAGGDGMGLILCFFYHH